MFSASLIRRVVAAGAPAIVVGVLAAQPAVAAAAPVTCGATLTSNSALTADLKCPGGNGLTLGPGVRLNLNGFTLTGNGTGTAVTMSPQGGDVIINGRISRWAAGFSQDSSDNLFGPPVVDSTVSGIVLDKAPGVVLNGASITVLDSTLTDSPVHTMYADIDVAHSSLTRSSINGSQTDISISDSTLTAGGVSGYDGGGVSITATTMDGTGFPGAPAACNQSGISISDSTVKNYSQRINGAGCPVSLVRTGFSHNPNGVLYSAFLEGIGGAASVQKSTFTTSGIAVEGDRTLTVTGSKFSNNITGVLIDDFRDYDFQAIVSGNVFLGNSSSGLRSATTHVSIGKNKSANNGRYGIYAPGATDLGGNIAYGNGLANCTGVVCATR